MRTRSGGWTWSSRRTADGYRWGHGSDQTILAGIVHDQSKLGIHVAEHVQAIFIVQRQQNFAVAVGLELVAPALQDLFLKAEAVQLAVAHHAVGTAVEGLHALRRQAHDGKAAEAHQTEGTFHDPLVVRAAHDRAQQILFELGGTQIVPGIAHNTTHISYPSFYNTVNKKIRQPIHPNC